MSTDRQTDNRFDFMVVCDGCGFVAGFTNVNAALGYAQRYVNAHSRCIPTEASNNTDGKRLTVLNGQSQFGYERAGRF